MKSFIKQIICSIFYYFGIINLILRFSLSRKKNLPVVILIYHRITENLDNEINDNLTINHPVINFKKEMEFLKRWFNVVSLDDALTIIQRNKYTAGPTLAITFDDGFEDNYRLVFPILRLLVLPATIYLTAGLIDTKELPWVEKLGGAIANTQEITLVLNSAFKQKTFNLVTLRDKRSAYEELVTTLKELDYTVRNSLIDEILAKLKSLQGTDRRMLTWFEIEEMSQHGISFGAHSMTHPILSRMPLDLAKREIAESKVLIEKKLKTEVKHFAYPNGRHKDFTPDLESYCKELGFVSVATAVYGNSKVGSDVYSLRRVSPGKTISIFAVDLVRAFLRKN
jgi:peptidoglycan/xylan/chitin deacetylase (PgdA/CDA1 family)